MIKSREIDDIIKGMRGFLPFAVVNSDPRNRIEKLLSYSANDVIPNSLSLMNVDGTARFTKLGVGVDPISALTIDFDPSLENGLMIRDSRDTNHRSLINQSGGSTYFYNTNTGVIGTEAIRILSNNNTYFSANVGVGTDTPSTSMTGGIHIKSTAGNSLILEKSSGAAMQFRSDATTIRASIAGINGADGLVFQTGAAQTERMRIDNAGNVGIGISPSFALDVDGNINISAGNTLKIDGVDAVFSNWSTNGATIYRNSNVGIGDFSGSAPTEALDIDGSINLSAGNTLKIDGVAAVFSNWTVNGSDIYRSSNVGIGTSYTPELLSITNNTGRATIYISSGSTNQGYISYFNATQTLSFGHGSATGAGLNGGQQLNILNQGHIGIGIISPTTFTGYTTLHHKNASGDVIQLVENDNGLIHQIITSGTDTVLIGSRSNHDLRIGTNDDEKVRITTTGLVGINTTNPPHALAAHIPVGNASSIVASFKSNSNPAQISFQGLGTTDNASARFGVYSDDNFALYQNDAYTFWFGEDKKFGIGTTSPITPIHLITTTSSAASIFDAQGSSNACYGQYQNDLDSYLQVGHWGSVRTDTFGGINTSNYAIVRAAGPTNGLIVGTSTSDPVVFATADTERLRITSAGLFEVTKSGSAEGLAKFESNDDVSVKLKSTFTASNGAHIYLEYEDAFASATDSFKAGIPGGSTNYVIGHGTTGSFTSANAIFSVTSAGSVGIGLASPSYKLEVAAGASTEGLAVTASSGDVYLQTDGQLHGYQKLDVTGAGLQIKGYSDGGGTKTEQARLWLTQSATSAAGGEIRFYTNNSSAMYERARITKDGDVRFYGASGDGMYWDHSASSLGIGTVAPSAPLEVYASATTAQNAAIVIDGPSGNNYEGIQYRVGGADQGYTAQEATGRMYHGAALEHIFRTGAGAGSIVGGTDRMRIGSNGNVGIGVGISDSIGEELVVNGAVLAYGVGGGAGTGNGTLYIGTTSNGRQFGIRTDATNRDLFIDRYSSGWFEAVRIDVGTGLLEAKSGLNVIGTTYSSDRIQSAAGFGGHNNGRRIMLPGGGEYNTSASTVTGAIKVRLPISWSNYMQRIVIKVYEYTTGESFEVVCGGYDYAAAQRWYNEFAYIIGQPNVDRNFTVRFGHDGTGIAVYIGELNSTWAYPQVFVTEYQAGYNGYPSTALYSGWNVSFITSWPTYSSGSTSNGVSNTLSNCSIYKHLQAIADGGTGATTAADARTNLGLGTAATYESTNYVRKSDLGNASYYSADSWISFVSTTAGLYWESGAGAGTHIHPADQTNINIRSGNTGGDVNIAFQDGNGTVRGKVGGFSGSGYDGIRIMNSSSAVLAEFRTSGAFYLNSHIEISSTTDEKINLSGSTNPFIRFEESTTDRAYIQWNASGNYLQIYNEEIGKGIKVGGSPTASFALDVDGYLQTSWIYQPVGTGIYGPSGHYLYTESGLGWIMRGSRSVFDMKMQNSSGTVLGYLYADSSTQGFLTTGGSWVTRIANDGSNELWHKGSMVVGDATVSLAPSYTLDVQGSIRATGDVISDSDVRHKTNIHTIDNALEKVNNMRGVYFTKNEEDYVGVIAQEIEEVLPEVVRTASNEEGTKSVSYGNIVGVLIEAIKEQQQQINELKEMLRK